MILHDRRSVSSDLSYGTVREECERQREWECTCAWRRRLKRWDMTLNDSSLTMRGGVSTCRERGELLGAGSESNHDTCLMYIFTSFTKQRLRGDIRSLPCEASGRRSNELNPSLYLRLYLHM